MPNHNVKELEAELQSLRKRVDEIEAMLAAQAQHEPDGHKAVEATANQEVPRELALVISAAVAAFLGKRATLRQIRLTGETPWAMQGRATIQASHAIEFVRGLR
jgi:methylmalonyl-CoA carboxyltransferase 12S subunit